MTPAGAWEPLDGLAGTDPCRVGSMQDCGWSVPQKNLRKKRLRAARMQRWAWTRRPSTLKVTSEKAWPLIKRFRKSNDIDLKDSSRLLIVLSSWFFYIFKKEQKLGFSQGVLAKKKKWFPSFDWFCWTTRGWSYGLLLFLKKENIFFRGENLKLSSFEASC